MAPDSNNDFAPLFVFAERQRVDGASVDLTQTIRNERLEPPVDRCVLGPPIRAGLASTPPEVEAS